MIYSINRQLPHWNPRLTQLWDRSLGFHLHSFKLELAVGKSHSTESGEPACQRGPSIEPTVIRHCVETKETQSHHQYIILAAL